MLSQLKSFIVISLIAIGGYIQPHPISVTTKPQCKNISKEQSITIVRNLPEVKRWFETPFPNGSKGVIQVEESKNRIWQVQVYEDVKDTTTGGHTATFNWYMIDKCTGKLKCSFNEYISGKYIKNNANYPCK